MNPIKMLQDRIESSFLKLLVIKSEVHGFYFFTVLPME